MQVFDAQRQCLGTPIIGEWRNGRMRYPEQALVEGDTVVFRDFCVRIPRRLAVTPWVHWLRTQWGRVSLQPYLTHWDAMVLAWAVEGLPHSVYVSRTLPDGMWQGVMHFDLCSRKLTGLGLTFYIPSATARSAS